jgi:AcrR family transcriptional regulator
MSSPRSKPSRSAKAQTPRAQPANTQPPRAYDSPVRDQQKEETRARIAGAARALFLKVGFDQATVDAIAKEAGVSGPTVYAQFGSKRGIVAELLSRARYSPAYSERVKEAMAETDPEKRVRATSRIARQVYDGERSEMELLRGAGIVSPELGDDELEKRRYAGQRKLIDMLDEKRLLRPGLTYEQARDVLFALTARDLYRQFVVERGWTSSQYQDWLADTLVSALMAR